MLMWYVGTAASAVRSSEARRVFRHPASPPGQFGKLGRNRDL